jgi:hypothetical protein
VSVKLYSDSSRLEAGAILSPKTDLLDASTNPEGELREIVPLLELTSIRASSAATKMVPEVWVTA